MKAALPVCLHKVRQGRTQGRSKAVVRGCFPALALGFPPPSTLSRWLFSVLDMARSGV